MKLIESVIPTLSDEHLFWLVKDCEHRIGSHVASCEPVEHYVEDQKKIITLAQDEIERRNSLK